MKKTILLLTIFTFLLTSVSAFAWGGRTDRYVLTFTGPISSTANVAPTATTLNGAPVAADYAIPIARARSISVKTDTALDAGSCTNTAGAADWDLNVIASNGTSSTEPFDTGTGTAYYTTYAGHADALVVTRMGITPVPTHIKFRGDEDGGNNLCLTVYVNVAFE